MVQLVEFLFLIGIAVFGMVLLFIVYVGGYVYFGSVYGSDSESASLTIMWSGFALMLLVMLASHSFILAGAYAGLAWFVLGTSRAVYREMKRPPARRQSPST